MLKMSHINYIRDLHNCGFKIGEIAEKSHVDPKTVRKYLAMEDFSPQPPKIANKPSILDPFKDFIHTCLDDDAKVWHKQHHTAKRIYDRLVEEQGFPGSYSVVQRYVKKIRNKIKVTARNELIWGPGIGQVDFGEAEFKENGVLIRLKYLVLSFPYSNDSYVQVFGGETAECVCQGLKNIFEYIGKVPTTLVFDNATGVGRRIGDVIHETVLFGQFRAHYNITVRFCNPYAGYEKGNVENKVKFVRSNLFVPVPVISGREEYNKQLLDKHKSKASEIHYKKGIQIAELFKEDLTHMRELPAHSFEVRRYDKVKADGYGKICIGGKHFYSTRPEYARQDVNVAIYADKIEVLDDNYNVLVTHKRCYGKERTDSYDYSTSVDQLLKTPGSWHESGVRQEAPDVLREYIDSLGRKERKSTLRMLKELTVNYDLHTSMDAMATVLRNGHISLCDAAVAAARISGYGLNTPPVSGPSLEVYNEVFIKGGESSAS